MKLTPNPDFVDRRSIASKRDAVHVHVKRKGKPWTVEHVISAGELHGVMMTLYCDARVEGVDVTRPDGGEYRP